MTSLDLPAIGAERYCFYFPDFEADNKSKNRLIRFFSNNFLLSGANNFRFRQSGDDKLKVNPKRPKIFCF